MLDKLIEENKKFKVILADPPWTFVTRSDKGKGKSPEKHYSCMSIDDIYKLEIDKVADKDCVLFLWIVDPLLPEALETIKAWGFKYKTVGFTWRKLTKTNKEHFGMGYYTRANPEMCLIATRGKVGRPKSKGVRQLFSSLVREHSRKPDEVYGYIEAMFDGPYLEVFSRNSGRKDWTFIGNEVGKF